MLIKNKNGDSCPQLVNPTILLNVEETFKTSANPPKMPSKKTDFYASQISGKNSKRSTIDMPCLKNIETNGYSKNTTEIIMASWKNNTKNKYIVYLKQWEIFCKNENINTSITLKQSLDFLTHLFKKGNKYSLFSSAQSVLSNLLPQYDGVEFGKHKHVKKVYARYIKPEGITTKILKDLEYKITF